MKTSCPVTSDRSLSKELQESLLEKYDHTGPERIGFIVNDKLVEVENQHPDAENFFDVSIEDLDYYEDKSSAIWHTQPGRNSQLSFEDYTGFMNFPNHQHIVIGADGIRCYRVEGNAVLKDGRYK